MASTRSTTPPSASPPPPKPASSTKSLSELLQEEQEPFVLEVYLFERGHAKKSSHSKGTTHGYFSPSYSNINNKLSSSSDNVYGPKGRRKRIISTYSASMKYLNTARTLLSKVVFRNEAIGLKWSLEIEDGKLNTGVQERKSGEERAESERSCSSDSCSTAFHYRSEIEEVENNTPINRGQSNHLQALEPVLQWKMVEENRDCSPVSVLDGIEPVPVYDNGAHSSGKRQESSSSASSFSSPNKPTEECLFSASLWELLVQSRNENSSGVVGPDSANFSQYINSKKALQQSKQLMFDCVREEVENQAKKQKKQSTQAEEKQLLWPDDFIGKIICDNMIKSWGKQHGDGKKLTQLVRSEVVGSPEEWCAFKGLFEKAIGKEVGDRILEDIKDELVEEMVNFCNT